MRVMRFMDETGDRAITLDDPKSFQEAKDRFNDLVLLKQTHRAMDTKGKGPINKFEDAGEETLVFPHLVGG